VAGAKPRKAKRMTPPQRMHRTKRVVVRSLDEHVQGTTVRIIEPGDLPTGCCHLRDGLYPCTHRMVTVRFGVEWRFNPESREKAPVVKMFGFCKTHRPKRIADAVSVDLPEDIIKQVNGSKSQKARMRRMEEAMYLHVVPEGGTQSHLVDRHAFTPLARSNWAANVKVLCDRTLKVAIAPTPKELRDFKGCQKCEVAKEVVEDE
jgi:hypothetical protein